MENKYGYGGGRECSGKCGCGGGSGYAEVPKRMKVRIYREMLSYREKENGVNPNSRQEQPPF